jgi:hypothetical protein
VAPTTKKPSLEEATELFCGRLDEITGQLAGKKRRKITKRLLDSRDDMPKRGGKNG